MPSFDFPTPPPSIDPTPIETLDAGVKRLQENKGRFASLSIDERIRILQELQQGFLGVAEEWVQAATRAKGLNITDPTAGEEWLAGPVLVLRFLRLLQQTLRDVRDHGVPQLPKNALSTRPDGRLVAKVFPASGFDSLLFQGFTGEVWMQPGVTTENLAQNQAQHYRQPNKEGQVALVLGAGNVSCIAANDTLYKLFAENEVVYLKMNPVNEYLGPIFEKAMMPLISRGFMAIAYGAAKEGAHLCQHEGIDTIHITGSDATHDAIVWGPANEREERKQNDTPVLNKPITSELGNVTPVIVVPGTWSNSDLQFQAENIATMVANNASFNCNAAKLLVMPKNWPQRAAFIDRIKSVLASRPNRKAYYPGAQDRWQMFVDAHPEAELLSPSVDQTVPWTFIGELDANNEDEICFLREPFCGVLHEVSLEAESAADFLDQAVAFCNDRVWGTLACSVLIHPKARKDAQTEAAFQRAIDNLRYGSIGVNHWAALCYGMITPTWGAYPGHTLKDIQSGQGVVHNTFLFDKPQKSVVYGPFRIFPKPPWFVTHARTHRIGPRLARFEASPSVLKFPAIALNAALG
jgi:hypothetical protein